MKLSKINRVMANTGAAHKGKNSISAAGELLLYGVIGDWWDELDAESVVKQLEKMSGDSIIVRIHSGGGYISEGLAIYNALKRSTKNVIVYIDGIAASMASVVAMAGDEIHMPDNALMMIHKPWMMAVGDAEQLRKDADVLDTMEGSLLAIYSGRTGIDRDTLKAMLQEETWLDGEQAKEQGFADFVISSVRAAATIDLKDVKPPQDKLERLFNDAAPPAKTQEQEQDDMNATTKPAVPGPANKQTPAEPAPANKQTPAEPAPAPVNEAELKAEATRAERARIKALREIGQQAKMPEEKVSAWLDGDITLDAARSEALAFVASKDAETQTNNHVRTFPAAEGQLRTAMAQAILNRVEPGRHKLDENSREFRSYSLLDMVKACLEASGENVRGKSKRELVGMAMHTTSDFPAILQDVANIQLRNAYAAAPRTFSAIAVQTSASDFRAKHSVQIGGGSGLEKVNEKGEFKHGTVTDSGESYKLETFGRIFKFSRQLIINDDIGALVRFMSQLGALASRKENQIVWNLVKSNPTLKEGNQPVYATHAARKNLVAGAAIDEASLSGMRKAMRQMKGLDGEPLSVALKTLVVNSERETEAQKMLALIDPTKSSDTNVFARSMDLIVEPLLDGVANDPFYGFADTNLAHCLEYCYLEGEEGPYIESQWGFEVDGLELKVRHDFAAGFVDFRGTVKGSGASG